MPNSGSQGAPDPPEQAEGLLCRLERMHYTRNARFDPYHRMHPQTPAGVVLSYEHCSVWASDSECVTKNHHLLLPACSSLLLGEERSVGFGGSLTFLSKQLYE